MELLRGPEQPAVRPQSELWCSRSRCSGVNTNPDAVPHANSDAGTNANSDTGTNANSDTGTNANSDAGTNANSDAVR